MKENQADGGKNASGTYQHIINLFQPHDVYIEGFLRSGSIIRRKKTAKFNFGFDIDPEIIKSFISLYSRSYNINNLDTGQGKNKIKKQRDLNVINLDMIKLLENSYPIINMLKAFNIKILLYLDPPYLLSTRKSQVKLYKFEMTDLQHEKLCMVLNKLNCDVVLSSYNNEIYNKHLSEWNTYSFKAITRKGMVWKTIYYNYPSPTELHEYTYLGNDFRERERIKGIIKRNVNKFDNMAEIERNYLLSELFNAFK